MNELEKSQQVQQILQKRSQFAKVGNPLKNDGVHDISVRGPFKRPSELETTPNATIRTE